MCRIQVLKRGRWDFFSALVPGSCFFREDVNHLIRFHFAKRDETLLAALDRLSEMDAKAINYR